MPVSYTLQRRAPISIALLPLAALTLSACAHHTSRLAVATGPYRPLNAGQWAPTRDDLRGPRAPLAPVDSPNAGQTLSATAEPER